MSYLFKISKKMTRRGKQHRINSVRFFHIANEGWFVYMRQEQMVDSNAQKNNDVAGPFKTKAVANSHLQRIVAHSQSTRVVEPEMESSNDAEDWRY